MAESQSPPGAIQTHADTAPDLYVAVNRSGIIPLKQRIEFAGSAARQEGRQSERGYRSSEEHPDAAKYRPRLAGEAVIVQELIAGFGIECVVQVRVRFRR